LELSAVSVSELALLVELL
jgi:hypothetical protein